MQSSVLSTNLSRGAIFVADLGDHFENGLGGQFHFGFRGSRARGFSTLVAVINPIDAINVDINSYCFDHGRVREAMNKFINAISAALNVRCSYSQDYITESSKELVGGMANEPIRDVSYYIEIRQ